MSGALSDTGKVSPTIVAYIVKLSMIVTPRNRKDYTYINLLANIEKFRFLVVYCLVK